MSTISHDPSGVEPRKRQWSMNLVVSEMWASFAIAVMRLAVLFTSVYGPDIASVSAGGSSSEIPSGVVVAFFRVLGTWSSPGTDFGTNRRNRPGAGPVRIELAARRKRSGRPGTDPCPGP